MKHIGLLFTPDMHQAIRAGVKGVTRRPMNPQPVWNQNGNSSYWSWKGVEWYDDWGVPDNIHCMSRYGTAGDLLYVKEETFLDPFGIPIYFESEWFLHPSKGTRKDKTWRSAMFMPKNRVRTWREIISVRAERLQAGLTREEILLEGIGKWDMGDELFDLFQQKWDSINAKRGFPFNSNLWVWRVELRREAGDGQRPERA